VNVIIALNELDYISTCVSAVRALCERPFNVDRSVCRFLNLVFGVPFILLAIRNF